MDLKAIFKNKNSVSPEYKKYKNRILSRKLLMYAVLIVSFVFVLINNIGIYSENYRVRLEPQMRRAVIQVARIVPQLEESETALRNVCDQMNNSWDRITADGMLGAADYDIPDTKAKLDQFIGETLSWMDRVTKLKVGRDGSVVVLDKDTMTVIAHPDPTTIGVRLEPDKPLTEENVLKLREIKPGTKAEDLNANVNFFKRHKPDDLERWRPYDIVDYFYRSLYGCIIEYDDYYIICGISLAERLSFIANAFFGTLILFVLIWLLIRWIGMVMDGRTETAVSMRNKLISGALTICLISLGFSIYSQSLSYVADELKTMTHHAEVAVETYETYKTQSKKLGNWLDTFYKVQCRLGALMVKKRITSLNRNTMQVYADYLNVKYIFLFDKDGNVVVTNSNYDHLKVGNKPEEPFYDFRILLEGADSVVMPPAHDERYGEYIQYVGVSIRNNEDLCDGFVMIGVDPALRDSLLDALRLEQVLKNLVIGIPEHAIAVDKETMQVAATTGLGYVGENIEELGISRENLEQNYSGFIEFNDTEYYVGVSSSEDYYFVPIMKGGTGDGILSTAFILMLEAAGVLLIIILLTLYRFQEDVIDAAPPEENETAEAEVVIDDDEEVKPVGLFSGLKKQRTDREKKGFEERWNVSSRNENAQTPENRVKKIVYRLLLVFCLFILMPTLYYAINSESRISEYSNLTYVLSGKWEKGVNIFACTACIFLLCAMYVGAVLADAILYRIARSYGTRVETVCLLLRSAIKYICAVIFIYYGLSKFGVKTQTLLASAGILSLMVSLAAKDMVSDILAGFFIIFESAYKVGDFIEVGNWSGNVTEIGLRTTKVKRGSNVKIFNNSSLRDIISSEEIVRQAVKIGISYDADIEEVGRILAEELAALDSEKIPGLVKGPKYDGISSFEDSSVMIQISMYVEGAMRFPATRALNHELKLIFDRNGIEIPYNQIVVHGAAENPDEKESI